MMRKEHSTFTEVNASPRRTPYGPALKRAGLFYYFLHTPNY
jgi:hypothetical protein